MIGTRKSVLVSSLLLILSASALGAENTQVQFEVFPKEHRKEIQILSACDQMQGVYFSGPIAEVLRESATDQRVQITLREPQSCETKVVHDRTICACNCPEGFLATSSHAKAEGSPTIVHCLKADVRKD